MIKQSFMVVGLPRSRTAWLAKFLTYRKQVCVHEPSLHWADMADLGLWLAKKEGASDSMLTWLAHDAKRLRVDLPIIVIRRNRSEVLESIKKLDYKTADYLPWYLKRLDERLDRIEDELQCFATSFQSLHSPTVCGRIFRMCLGEKMPAGWWERWRDENVQANITETLKLIKENEEGIKTVYGAFPRREP